MTTILHTTYNEEEYVVKWSLEMEFPPSFLTLNRIAQNVFMLNKEYIE
jgi:hypothetical protein